MMKACGVVLVAVLACACGGSGQPTDSSTPAKKRDARLIVLHQVLEPLRIAGNRVIPPPDAVRLQVQQQHRRRIVASLMMCLDNNGRISELKLMRRSGYPRYDRHLLSEISKWRYKPLRRNGRPVAVCTSLTYIYHRR